MKTSANGTPRLTNAEARPTESLLVLHAELLRLEDLAKHYCLTEVELLIGAAAQAASEVLNREHTVLN